MSGKSDVYQGQDWQRLQRRSKRGFKWGFSSPGLGAPTGKGRLRNLRKKIQLSKRGGGDAQGISVMKTTPPWFCIFQEQFCVKVYADLWAGVVRETASPGATSPPPLSK